jgi:hypothetical protein
MEPLTPTQLQELKRRAKPIKNFVGPIPHIVHYGTYSDLTAQERTLYFLKDQNLYISYRLGQHVSYEYELEPDGPIKNIEPVKPEPIKQVEPVKLVEQTKQVEPANPQPIKPEPISPDQLAEAFKEITNLPDNLESLGKFVKFLKPCIKSKNPTNFRSNVAFVPPYTHLEKGFWELVGAFEKRMRETKWLTRDPTFARISYNKLMFLKINYGCLFDREDARMLQLF